MTAGQRVLRWVLARNETNWVGAGLVVAATLEEGFVCLYTVEADQDLDVDVPKTAETGRWVRAYRTGIAVPVSAAHVATAGYDLVEMRHVFDVGSDLPPVERRGYDAGTVVP